MILIFDCRFFDKSEIIHGYSFLFSSVPKREGLYYHTAKRGTVYPHLQAEGPEKAPIRKDDDSVPRIRVKLLCLSFSYREPLRALWIARV